MEAAGDEDAQVCLLSKQTGKAGCLDEASLMTVDGSSSRSSRFESA